MESCIDVTEEDVQVIENGDVYLKDECKEKIDEGDLITTAPLKESQRNNIMGIQQLQQKGSSNQFPPPSSVVSDEENRPPPITPTTVPVPDSAPNSSEVWRERCEVITSEEHNEHIEFASEIVRNLIDELHIESDADLDRSVVCFGSETRSVCSLELSPSETSFDTAKEEAEEEEADSPLDKTPLGTDTEFESVDEDRRSDSDSFSYDRCKTVVAVRSSDVLVDSGHDHLCRPIACDLSDESNLDQSVAVENEDVVVDANTLEGDEITLNETGIPICDSRSVVRFSSSASDQIPVETESESTFTEIVESEPVLVDSYSEKSFTPVESEPVLVYSYPEESLNVSSLEEGLVPVDSETGLVDSSPKESWPVSSLEEGLTKAESEPVLVGSSPEECLPVTSLEDLAPGIVDSSREEPLPGISLEEGFVKVESELVLVARSPEECLPVTSLKGGLTPVESELVLVDSSPKECSPVSSFEKDLTRVGSEPVLLDSSPEECLPVNSLEDGLVIAESELGCQSNGSNVSPNAVFNHPTILSCDVSNVEQSAASDIKEARLDLSEPDNLKENFLEDPQIEAIPLQSETIEEAASSLSELQTDGCLEPVLKSESLENGLEDHKDPTTVLFSEGTESVDSPVLVEVHEELRSESDLNVSIELDAVEGSQISGSPVIVVRSEVEDSIVTPDVLAEDFSKLDLNSEFVESDLPIGASLIREEVLLPTEGTVDSSLNVTFPSVSSISIQSERDLQNDQTELVNADVNNFDETLRPEEPSFEDQTNEKDDVTNDLANRVSSQTETLVQKVTSSEDNDLTDTTFVCTSEPFNSTVGVLNDVDFEQILKTESSYIVEELVNLSQHDSELEEVETGESTVKMPTAASQQSEDVGCADVENNEALSLDVNINPFETRSKLSGSPQRRLPSAVDNERPIDTNEQKTTTTEVSSNPTNESPKRRSSDTVEPCSPSGDSADSPKDDAIEESGGGGGIESADVFKTPAKVNSPTPDIDDGQTQQCLMESSMSEDSGIDVPPTSRPRSSASTAVEDCSMMTQSVESRSAVNFSEAGPDVAECKQEEFRSATDFFMDPSSLDFLEKCDSGKFAESALSRMSLYMKFDPLVPGNSPMSRRLTMWLKQQQDAANRDTKTGSELSGSPSKSLDSTIEFDRQKLIDLEASPLKVAAAVSSDSKTSADSSLSLTGEPMPQQQEDGKKLCDEEVRQMLKIQELLFQDRQLMKDREWDDKLKAVEMEKQQLIAQVQSLRESQHQMRQIVGEYEKTISQLISDKEHDKQTMTESASQVTKERDQALEDLQSVETAFADLHRRYEKAKTAVEGFKKNEDTLKGCVNDLQTKLKRQVEKYELLRNRAEERLESANVQIENMGKANESEVAALRAQLKKSEMMVSGLENSLEQKVKENAELTSICDELIAQVGHKT